MKITFLCTGKTNDRHISVLMKMYQKRLGNYCSFQLVETNDTKAKSTPELKKKETAALQKEIHKADCIVLLDETGRELSSVQLANFVQKKQLDRKKHLLFVIGGAFGFNKEIQELADDKISLSKMTFPHQLVRIIFLEQLYRAFTILHHEPYHH